MYAYPSSAITNIYVNKETLKRKDSEIKMNEIYRHLVCAEVFAFNTKFDMKHKSHGSDMN